MSGKLSDEQRSDGWAWTVALFVISVALAVCASGVLAPLSSRLVEMAFATFARPASGQIVLVDIDTRSLGEIGAWPWSRKTYAKAVDILHDAGASTIVLDLDLPPVPPAAQGDALARAVIRAKGSVVFRSEVPAGFAGPGGSDSSLAYRIARVVPSGAFAFDYSIDPASIPRVSFLDVYDANFNLATLKGKRVVIGATALLLGDRVLVPGHGALSRSERSILMAEALLQNLEIRDAGAVGQALVVLLTVVFLWPARRSWTFNDLVVPTAAAVWAAVVVAVLVYEYTGVVLDPVAGAVAAAAVVVWVGIGEFASRVHCVMKTASGGSFWRLLADLLDDEKASRGAATGDRKPSRPDVVGS